MGFLSKILGREQTSKVESAPAECLHAILIPHWDSIDDMGKEDLATSFTCQTCGQSFTPDEAKVQRQVTLQRLQNV